MSIQELIVWSCKYRHIKCVLRLSLYRTAKKAVPVQCLYVQELIIWLCKYHISGVFQICTGLLIWSCWYSVYTGTDNTAEQVLSGVNQICTGLPTWSWRYHVCTETTNMAMQVPHIRCVPGLYWNSLWLHGIVRVPNIRHIQNLLLLHMKMNLT